MDRDRRGERDWIELTDGDLEEPTVGQDEFDAGRAVTPTVTVDACPRCGGAGRIAGPMELVGGFPPYCTWSGAKWFWCSGLRLVGSYVP